MVEFVDVKFYVCIVCFVWVFGVGYVVFGGWCGIGGFVVVVVVF